MWMLKLMLLLSLIAGSFPSSILTQTSYLTDVTEEENEEEEEEVV